MMNRTIPARIFIPLLLFVLGCAISLTLGQVFLSLRASELERAFENESTQITSLVDSRMMLYTNVLYGTQGLFAASNFVDDNEWQDYISTLDLADNYRGISSMLYIQDVPAAATSTLPFPIYPYSPKAEYFPITYIARSTAANTSTSTVSSTSTIGFDISSEAGRRSALLAASTTHQPSATPVVLSAGADPLPILSIYAPVYAEGSTSTQPTGYVAAVFRVKELFEGLASDPIFDRNIDVTIKDSDGAVLLDTSASRSLAPAYSNRVYDTSVTVAGRVWTLHFRALSSYSLGTFADLLPWLVLGFGLLLSALLAFLSYLFVVSRERAITSRTLQLDTLIRNFPYGVVVEDEKRTIMYANQRAVDLFAGKPNAVPVASIIGKSTRMLTRQSAGELGDSNAVLARIDAVTAAGAAVLGEKVSLPGNRTILRDYVPLFDNGQRFGGVWTYKDVTEEENIDRMKTEFVSLASHQLRTPLTSIKWYTELLLDDAQALPTEQADYAREIEEAAKRMNDLVSALLDISRLDLGTFMIEPAPEDLIAIMQSAVEEQLPTIQKKKQQFSFTHPDALPKVNVDHKLAFIIVQNLISNAMKYSPEGASIHLSLEVNAAGEYVISCADTGYGIPKKDQPNIFKKLFRADNIRTLDVEGTGLGLYMIKTIAEAADCRIAFTSEEGKGTTFIFTIPASGMKAKSGTKTLGE